MGCKMPWWAGSENPPPDKDKIISDLRAKLTAAEQRAREAEKDAERYRWVKKQHKPGAYYNGQIVNDKLLSGHRDRNRILLSFMVKDQAASDYASPIAQNLDAAIDAAIAASKED
jgi:hypothetical protein